MIKGVPTSIAALLGETERGTTEPRSVKSLADFQLQFGAALGGEEFLHDAVDGFFQNGGREAIICRIVANDATTATSDTLPIEAVGPGVWGTRIFVKLSADGSDTGFSLKLAYFGSDLAVPADNPFDDAAVLATAAVLEQFTGLNTDQASAGYWVERLQESALVRAAPAEAGLPSPGVHSARLQGGSDGGPVVSLNFLGVDTADRTTGLAALQSPYFDEVSLLAAPGASDPGLVAAICAHCEQKLFRFAVLDGPREPINILDLDPREDGETSRAAYYVPWLKVADARGQSRLVPPSGHVLGVIARTDTERGIWKAPANQPVRGVIGVQTIISDAQQDVLNPKGVNAIREFPGRGIRVWGARTLSSNPELKYIPVRRFLSWLERSLYEGTQWATFEPQGDPLWARLREEVRLFLREQWRAGALMGQKEEEAFFVKCDQSTMTQADIQSGRLICEIGVAVVRRAEFIIFRLTHQLSD